MRTAHERDDFLLFRKQSKTRRQARRNKDAKNAGKRFTDLGGICSRSPAKKVARKKTETKGGRKIGQKGLQTWALRGVIRFFILRFRERERVGTKRGSSANSDWVIIFERRRRAMRRIKKKKKRAFILSGGCKEDRI